MNYLATLLGVLMLFSCGPSGKEVEVLEALQVDGYSLEKEDSSSFSFSSSQPSPGELEQRLIDAGLVNIQTILPEIWVELKYATEDNFFGKNVYGELRNCYLQPAVARMLADAHRYLKEDYANLTFKVYDGVRPLSVQQILWDELDKPDRIKPLYVADPRKGSLHNFGVAVDLTLAVSQTGEEIDMGTTYDFFGYPAYPDREDQMLSEGKITKQQVKNRTILRKAMIRAGFKGIGSEWWHFNAFTRKVAGEKFEMVK